MTEEERARTLLNVFNWFFFLLVSLPYAVVPYNRETEDFGWFVLDLTWVRVLAWIGVAINIAIFLFCRWWKKELDKPYQGCYNR